MKRCIDCHFFIEEYPVFDPEDPETKGRKSEKIVPYPVRDRAKEKNLTLLKERARGQTRVTYACYFGVWDGRYKKIEYAKDLMETDRGNPYHRSVVSMRIKRAAERILGRSGSAHVIRHSVGTETQKRTGDIFFMAQYLGHKSIQTTIDYYAHVNATFAQKKAIFDAVQGQRN